MNRALGEIILLYILMAGSGVGLLLIMFSNYQRQQVLCDARKKEEKK